MVGAISGNKDRGGWRAGPDEAAAHQLVVAHTLTAPDPSAEPKDGKRAEGHDAGEDGTGRGVPMVTAAMSVRRLTPNECARLQAFPDGWCCLDQPLESWAVDPEAAAERCRCPDSPQYRCYGNAVTVSVVEWIARRAVMNVA